MNQDRSFFSVPNFLLLVSLLMICRLFANYTLPVFDQSEARYANVCANMAKNGNFLEPQFVHNGELQIFQGKPPLYFQMGGISCKLFGINEFSVRFPAFLSAAGILLVLFYTVKTLRDERSACFSALLCAFTPVFLGFSGFCMTDLLLAFSICGAVCFYALFLAEEKKTRRKIFSILVFASLGIGMMVKGPVAIVMAGLPVFFFTLLNRRWRDLLDHAWFSGLLVFLLIAAPWYIMMQSKNPDFLEYFFINENFKRFLFKEYGDRYGAGRESFKGMALLFMLLCNLPFLLLAFVPLFQKKLKALTLGKFREYLKDPLSGLAFLWLVSNTLFWCLTSRVLITYLLPTIPAAAILLPDLLKRSDSLQSGSAEHKLKCLFSALCILYCAAGLLGNCCMPELQQNAGHFWSSLSTLKTYENTPFYFVKNTPYSAEFYMKGRVRNHPKEERTVSQENSRDCILLATQRDLKRIRVERKVICTYGPWVVFAPEKQ